MTTTEAAVTKRTRVRQRELRFSHRAVLTAGGVGFALGILVAAAFVPLLKTSSPPHRVKPLPTPVPYSAAGLRDRIRTLVEGSLRPSDLPGRYGGKSRILSVSVTPLLPTRYPGQAFQTVYNLRINFLLDYNTSFPSLQKG